jgi:serine phosphatase RsbU (regulator of sigma subunit)
VRFIDPPDAGLPLGLKHLATASREPGIVSLEPGDRMLFYTDGVSEARGKSGEFYPLDDCGALLDGQDLDTGLDRLRDDVTRYVGHALRDDAAMLLISSGPPSPRVAGSQLPESSPSVKAPATNQGST